MTPSATPIAVIGAGSWGTALAIHLARNQQLVRLWGLGDMRVLQETRINSRYLPDHVLPDHIEIALTLEQALAGVEDVLVVVPSHGFAEVLRSIKPLLDSFRLVWGTKGLDDKTGLTLDEVARRELGSHIPLAVLSGPSFAVEVADQKPTAITLATTNHRFFEDLTHRFRSPTFRLYKTTDVLGVELCGVVKNVLAIATGISDGLAFGANARSALITRGMAETARLLQVYGGSTHTLMGLAGIGDMILTCTTDLSRNRRFGLLIGEGASTDAAKKAVGQVVEGYINTAQLYQIAQTHQIDMPIVAAVYQILYQGRPPLEAAQELLIRGSGSIWE